MHQPPPTNLSSPSLLASSAGIPVGKPFGTTPVGRVSRVIAGQLSAEVEVPSCEVPPKYPQRHPELSIDLRPFLVSSRLWVVHLLPYSPLSSVKKSKRQYR